MSIFRLLIVNRFWFFASTKNVQMNFEELHQQSRALLLANVWDVPSAKIAEELNFQAIGTSSAAIAAMMGYQDGEDLSFAESKRIVENIAKNSKLPLSVDLESGYSDEPNGIAENIIQLAQLGVTGINIEDSQVLNGRREIMDADNFANTLNIIRAKLQKANVEMFINARTDLYLLGISNAISDTKSRIRLYENAGANGIFIPGLTDIADIREIVASTSLPINVMCMPTLPDFDSLQEIGVKRISMGNFIFEAMYKGYKLHLSQLKQEASFKSIFV